MYGFQILPLFTLSFLLFTLSSLPTIPADTLEELALEFPGLFPEPTEEPDLSRSFDRGKPQLNCYRCGMNTGCFAKRNRSSTRNIGRKFVADGRKRGCYKETHVCGIFGPNPNKAPGKAGRSCLARNKIKPNEYEMLQYAQHPGKSIYAYGCERDYCNSEEWKVYENCMPDPSKCRAGEFLLIWHKYLFLLIPSLLCPHFVVWSTVF